MAAGLPEHVGHLLISDQLRSMVVVCQNMTRQIQCNKCGAEFDATNSVENLLYMILKMNI